VPKSSGKVDSGDRSKTKESIAETGWDNNLKTTAAEKAAMEKAEKQRLKHEREEARRGTSIPSYSPKLLLCLILRYACLYLYLYLHLYMNQNILKPPP
jgi:hypothetical protein